MNNTLKDYRIGCLLLALIAMLVLFMHPSKQQKSQPTTTPCASSQAPAWEFSGGSSSFPSREAGASHLGSQAGAWEPA
ncbi:hypothetical protein [Methylobacter tundripaludum]|uniref:hypothetical protein n=1 Tax=Methylobacter tundripaludum TaxID=173365 RepID=UPI0012374768|nr:hypothetical protein [Methylobacter tundripaludum]